MSDPGVALHLAVTAQVVDAVDVRDREHLHVLHTRILDHHLVQEDGLKLESFQNFSACYSARHLHWVLFFVI